jgi:hypothetical protein
MSRVLFLNIDEGEAVAKCLAENIGISAMERLPGGGVGQVCMSGEGAATLNRKLKARLIKGEVARAPHRPARPLW